MIEEDTTSEEEQQQIKISRVGYIEMKKVKKSKKISFQAVHCLLIGGSFYWYKDAKSTEPLGGCALRESTIENNVKVGNKDCFILKKDDDTEIFTGNLTSETNRDAWVQAFNDAKNKDPHEQPTRDEIKGKQKGIMGRATGKIASATSTSVIGKKVMKAIINEETTTLLNALKNIVRVESDNPKKADELEKNIIKIAVKSYLLIDKGKLDPDEFLKADKPLREAFELLVRCYNGRNRVSSDVLYEALVKIEGSLREAEEILTNLLAPHLTAKNLFRISSAFGVFADSKFLLRVFQDTPFDEELEKLIDAMEYYTQFHYT